MIKATVLTISDSCAAQTRQDLSGPAIKDMLISANIDVGEILIVPDDQDQIAARLKSLCDAGDIDVIITTGGTGFGPRDVTPEATLSICDRIVPDLMEASRAEGYNKTPKAILSARQGHFCPSAGRQGTAAPHSTSPRSRTEKTCPPR